MGLGKKIFAEAKRSKYILAGPALRALEPDDAPIKEDVDAGGIVTKALKKPQGPTTPALASTGLRI